MYLKSNSNSLSCNCNNNNNCTLQMNKNNMKIDSRSSECSNKMEIKKIKKDINSNNNHNQRGDAKKNKTTEVRKEEVLAIRNRFPTKIPVIVQRFYKETHLPQLDKSKFLVPQEITMSQFQTIIRNKMRMNQNQSLYLLVNNRTMMSLSTSMSEVYSEHAGTDGFLYITYASQEVFGSDGNTASTKQNRIKIK
ncbi:unnamed protein product [Brassicogethes aeneus]|uniref:Microtubule-associated proteins 1A/1B light chain 3C-like n=1 Tax=Brassicogethes aeneus TaxID=1431903 RepID=A0A9P0ASP7_BRAAE|nr:unnamed protein product [Brassicogethes aeneus]